VTFVTAGLLRVPLLFVVLVFAPASILLLANFER
jgi:hypothetical protein